MEIKRERLPILVKSLTSLSMLGCRQLSTAMPYLFPFPGSGRSPGVGNGTPLQYSCLENSMGSGAWWDTAYGATKSQTLLSDWTQYNTIGGIIQYLVFWDRLFYLACLQSLCVLCVRECTIMSNSMDCSLPGSSSYGIFQARILEPGAVSSSRGSSLPRDQIRVSCIGRQILYH